LKIKLKVRHFNIIEVIEAESQEMLNTRYTTSWMHLKIDRSGGNGAYAWKRSNSRAMVASTLKVSF
jgi:hypothetical protein